MTKRVRVLDPNDVVTHGGLTRADIARGGILATPEQHKAFALAELRHSRDAERDATIFLGKYDIEARARTAGVRVDYVHCDLTAQTVERRTVDGREGTA